MHPHGKWMFILIEKAESKYSENVIVSNGMALEWAEWAVSFNSGLSIERSFSEMIKIG